MMDHLKMRATPLQTKRKSLMKTSRVSMSCQYTVGGERERETDRDRRTREGERFDS